MPYAQCGIDGIQVFRTGARTAAGQRFLQAHPNVTPATVAGERVYERVVPGANVSGSSAVVRVTYETNEDGITDVSFTINGLYSRQNLTPEGSAAALNVVRDSLKEFLSTAPNGAVIRADVFDADDDGSLRQLMYMRAGFYADGLGRVSALVQDGRIVPAKLEGRGYRPLKPEEESERRDEMRNLPRIIRAERWRPGDPITEDMADLFD